MASTVVASCDPGDPVTGGGVSPTGLEGDGLLIDSFPSSPFDWFGNVIHSGGAGTVEAIVHAVCADVTP